MDRDARFSHSKRLRDGPAYRQTVRKPRVGGNNDCAGGGLARAAMRFAETTEMQRLSDARGRGKMAVAAVHQATVCWMMDGWLSHCLR